MVHNLHILHIRTMLSMCPCRRADRSLPASAGLEAVECEDEVPFVPKCAKEAVDIVHKFAELGGLPLSSIFYEV